MPHRKINRQEPGNEATVNTNRASSAVLLGQKQLFEDCLLDLDTVQFMFAVANRWVFSTLHLEFPSRMLGHKEETKSSLLRARATAS